MQLARSFWFGQLLLLAVWLGLIVAEWQHDALRRLPPTPRTSALTVASEYDYPTVIADDQLREVLQAIKPRFRGEKPRINHVDHALRFWGLAACFDDEQCLSGQEMRDILTSHPKFAAVWGTATEPLLRLTPSGVSVRTQDGPETASHIDHTLAGLAEVGTPVDFPIVTADGAVTYQDMLLDSFRSFQLNQVEYEWSAMTYASFFPHVKRWYSKDGQEITFDRLAGRLMREPLYRGVCYGNHRLYTLAVMLRIDDTHDILSRDVRDDVEHFLQDATNRLIQSQHADGHWDGLWSQPNGPVDDEADATSRAVQMMVTGHTLEWWAIAPANLHPPRETLVRAGQWLYRTIVEFDQADVDRYYTYLTHAGRALALWRGTTPEALACSGWLEGNSADSPSELMVSTLKPE